MAWMCKKCWDLCEVLELVEESFKFSGRVFLEQTFATRNITGSTACNIAHASLRGHGYLIPPPFRQRAEDNPHELAGYQDREGHDGESTF